MNTWRKFAAIALAGIMAFALVACTTAPAAEPETEPTKDAVAPTGEGSAVVDALAPTVDPETFKEYINTWYADGSSAGYRLLIKEAGTWELTDPAGEVAASGSLRFNDEDQMLEMYDPDGSVAITATIEEDGVIHCEIMLESLSDTLSTNYFYNKITNDISDAPPVDVENSFQTGSEDEIAPPSEDSAVTG